MGEPPIAFVARPDATALEIRVNFGIFAGREATAAELDELARELLPTIGEVSIISELRHEVSEETEVALHQVRVEIAREQLPESGRDQAVLAERLVAVCERWASACAAARHAEITEL